MIKTIKKIFWNIYLNISIRTYVYIILILFTGRCFVWFLNQTDLFLVSFQHIVLDLSNTEFKFHLLVIYFFACFLVSSCMSHKHILSSVFYFMQRLFSIFYKTNARRNQSITIKHDTEALDDYKCPFDTMCLWVTGFKEHLHHLLHRWCCTCNHTWQWCHHLSRTRRQRLASQTDQRC